MFGMVHGDNVGWLKYFEENPTEFHDLRLVWEGGTSTALPSWLYGVFVRNGPAQVSANLSTLLKPNVAFNVQRNNVKNLAYILFIRS